ncbi:hypothetical protein IE81DRAFT_321039, partial [Ceraceosorus guamensis]
ISVVMCVAGVKSIAIVDQDLDRDERRSRKGYRKRDQDLGRNVRHSRKERRNRDLSLRSEKSVVRCQEH